MRTTLMALAMLIAGPAGVNASSPYAGMTERPIRALSAEQQADRRSAGPDPGRAFAHASGAGGAAERGTNRRLFPPARLYQRLAAAWWFDDGRPPASLM